MSFLSRIKNKIKSILFLKGKNQREINQKHSYDYPDENNGWHKIGKSPVYGNESTNSVFDPFVLKDNKRFLMAVSERKNHGIDLLESTDGIKWAKISTILTSRPNTWEHFVNRASIILVNGVWHMWYTGQSPHISKIGHAISLDGIHYQRQSKPCLVATLKHEGVSVMNPCVLWNETKQLFQMWYAAGENYEPDVLFYAESKDGDYWIKKESPVLTKYKKNKWEKYKVGGCDVKKQKDGTYIMYYIGYQNLDVARICYAISVDGINWIRPSFNLCIAPTANSWDSAATYKPSVVEDNGKLYMWYNGRNGISEYIGLAIK